MDTEERDKEIWGMVWRYGLLMILVALASAVAFIIFKDNLILMLVSVTAIWLTPMYLANRSRSRSFEK